LEPELLFLAVKLRGWCQTKVKRGISDVGRGREREKAGIRYHLAHVEKHIQKRSVSSQKEHVRGFSENQLKGAIFPEEPKSEWN